MRAPTPYDPDELLPPAGGGGGEGAVTHLCSGATEVDTRDASSRSRLLRRRPTTSAAVGQVPIIV